MANPPRRKERKELTTGKKLKKKVRKLMKPKNLGNLLILAATIALLATSILPYLF